MVDLYYALYGSKRPVCLQSAEMNSMYKEFVREGAIKKTTTISPSPAILTPEPKPEIIRDDVDAVVEQKPPTVPGVTTTLKRTATEAFAVGDEIIKLETHEEITVVNEEIKDEDIQEIQETETTKVDITSTTVVETETEYVSETKKLKSEVFEEDDNSITIIDVSESTVTRMDSSFDSAKADNDFKQKVEGSSKVCSGFIKSNLLEI